MPNTLHNLNIKSTKFFAWRLNWKNLKNNLAVGSSAILATAGVVSLFSVGTVAISPSVLKLTPEPTCLETQALAKYYNNKSFFGTPVLVRCEDLPGQQSFWFDRDFTKDDLPGVTINNFSARFTSQRKLSSGQYELKASADNQLKLFVNDQQVLTVTKAKKEVTANVKVETGMYRTRIDFVNRGDKASAVLTATPVQIPETAVDQPVPTQPDKPVTDTPVITPARPTPVVI
jgi:hypothetical protein